MNVTLSLLDWSGDKRRNPKAVNHWLHGRRLPCRICGKLTFLCDNNGDPCHKVCAEAQHGLQIDRSSLGPS
ncbi:hypothetical protein ACIG5D_04005 [Microbispora rosea]|uniref:hypothetical protein n=1 Tax=Microbispora rosea TaxID=58117 RepID=UPI0037C8DEE1